MLSSNSLWDWVSKQIGAKDPHLSTIFALAFRKSQGRRPFLIASVQRLRLGATPGTMLFEKWL
jgi:hypothetical protein